MKKEVIIMTMKEIRKAVQKEIERVRKFDVDFAEMEIQTMEVFEKLYTDGVVRKFDNSFLAFANSFQRKYNHFNDGFTVLQTLDLHAIYATKKQAREMICEYFHLLPVEVEITEASETSSSSLSVQTDETTSSSESNTVEISCDGKDEKFVGKIPTPLMYEKNSFLAKKIHIMGGNSEVYQRYRKIYPLLSRDEFILAIRWLCDDSRDINGHTTRAITITPKGIKMLKKVNCLTFTNLFEVIGGKKWDGEVREIDAITEHQKKFADEMGKLYLLDKSYITADNKI